MKLKEMWRPVPGFYGYEASSEGRIRSYRHSKVRPLVLSKDCIIKCLRQDHNGRLVVNLSMDGKITSVIVSRIVMSAFLGYEISKSVAVHHLNHIITDNRIINLSVIPKKEHDYKHRSEKWGGDLDNKIEAVINMSKNGYSIAEIKDTFGVSTKTINRIRSHYGICKEYKNKGRKLSPAI